MMRPVINLLAKKVEYVGTFEQLYLDICIIPEEAYPGVRVLNTKLCTVKCSKADQTFYFAADYSSRNKRKKFHEPFSEFNSYA